MAVGATRTAPPAAQTQARCAARLLSAATALCDTLGAPHASAGSDYPEGPLTRRERDVARLIARGCTDHQIAATLTIRVSTVGTHVHHVLAKLGLCSRWQVAEPMLAREV